MQNEQVFSPTENGPPAQQFNPAGVHPMEETSKPADLPPPVSPLPEPAPMFTASTPVPPPPPQAPVSLPTATNDQPVAVVQALSIRGVEYTMMSLTLWFTAAALIWIALTIVNGSTAFDMLSLPAALLIVCVPIFGYLFLRLRKQELANPTLRFDPSKRRLTQFTQIFAFATCLFNLIAFAYVVLQQLGGQGSGSLLKSFLSLLVVLVIAGGVLAYYWLDEHRNLT